MGVQTYGTYYGNTHSADPTCTLLVLLDICPAASCLSDLGKNEERAEIGIDWALTGAGDWCEGARELFCSVACTSAISQVCSLVRPIDLSESERSRRAHFYSALLTARPLFCCEKAPSPSFACSHTALTAERPKRPTPTHVSTSLIKLFYHFPTLPTDISSLFNHSCPNNNHSNLIASLSIGIIQCPVARPCRRPRCLMDDRGALRY